MRLCEQNCGKIATVYAGGNNANDWAGSYCVDCVPKGFTVWQFHPNGFGCSSDDVTEIIRS